MVSVVVSLLMNLGSNVYERAASCVACLKLEVEVLERKQNVKLIHLIRFELIRKCLSSIT